MKTKTIIIITALTLSAMLLASNGFADIPAPPVNQTVGLADTIMNNLVEAECRACHEDPEIVEDTSIPDRHHLLYGSSIIYGECPDESPCLSAADCTGAGQDCKGETAASDPYANADLTSGVYGCMSCHEEDTSGGTTNFLVERDCLVCHLQVGGEASVHHLTATAQGTLPPGEDLGEIGVGDCTPCHGTLVDDIGDSHIIPTYAPSLVTPSVLDGSADETNSYGAEAGACNFCHLSNSINPTNDPVEEALSGVDVYNNGNLHHGAGPYKDRQGNSDFGDCLMCHTDPNAEIPGFVFPNSVLAIRGCEKCHGMESLHNIQADSPNAANLGTIVVGGEDAGYGHIGRDAGPDDSDCWGCHGFGFASTSAPGSGPVTPLLSDADKKVILTGTDTTITLSGSSLTNTSGTTEFLSSFILTSQDGTVVEITPEQINAFSSTIIIPGTTAPGNYLLTATKNSGAVISNPLAISIKPPTIITTSTTVTCGGCEGTLTILGSGFGDAPVAGLISPTEEFLNVTQDDMLLTIESWTDGRIEASGAMCDEDAVITVNGLFGSATK